MGNGPTVTKTRTTGGRRWKLDWYQGGIRKRRFYKTREEAEEAADMVTLDLSTFGSAVANWPAGKRAAIAAAVDEIEAAGSTIGDALRAWREWKDSAPKVQSPLLAVAVTEFLEAKELANRRPRYLQELRHVTKWLGPLELLRVRQVSTADLQAILARRRPSAWTGRGIVSKWRSFFGWCQKRCYCTANPAAGLDSPTVDDQPPCILTPDQGARLLAAAQRVAPQLVGFLALQMFAGVRPVEACRLLWADVRAECVEIRGTTAKTRRRRLVPVNDTLAAWLAIAPREGSGPRPPGFRCAWKRLREASAIRWGHDILRHSFVSYHLAEHQDAARTAFIAGHREDILFIHYRQLTTPTAAAAWWALRPTARPQGKPQPAN
jgi:integrase